MSWRYTAERWPFCGQMKTGLLDDIEYGQILAPSPEAGGTRSLCLDSFGGPHNSRHGQRKGYEICISM